MEAGIKYGVLIADEDRQYAKKLYNVLLDVFNEQDVSFETVIINSATDFKEFTSQSFDLAIIDHLFLLVEGKSFIPELERKNPDCIYILLISDKGGAHLREILQSMEKKTNHFFEEIILKDNHNYQVLFHALEKQVEKIIKRNG